MNSRITLYNESIHGDVPRREFFRRVTEIAGSTAAATALLALLEPNWALGQQVNPDDQRLATKTVTYEGATGPVQGYLARPIKAKGPLPGILVTLPGARTARAAWGQFGFATEGACRYSAQ